MPGEAQKGTDRGVDFNTVLRDEITQLNTRRLEDRKLETAPGAMLDTVGLALSGGGIRSAAISLGVLQAFNERGVLKKLDYLSTVSGGGYIGCSLTASMTVNGGKFPFADPVASAAGSPLTDVPDTEAVRHIRNYSNYLIPSGAGDLISGLAIVIRGLVANMALLLPIVLIMAALTVLTNPDRSDLTKPDLFGLAITWLPVRHFGVTLLLSLVGFGLFFAWALYRSFLSTVRQSEFNTLLPRFAGGYLLVVAFSFLCELQPFVIAGIFDLTDKPVGSEKDFSLLTASVQWLATIATPVAAAVTFFRQQLGTLLKSVDTQSGMTAKIMSIIAKGAIWVAGAALPLLIWIGYLYLCYWGIINNAPPPPAAPASAQAQPASMQAQPAPAQAQPAPTQAQSMPDGEQPPSRMAQGFQGFTWPQGLACSCPNNTCVTGSGDHTPSWLLNTAQLLSGLVARCQVWRPITLFYIFAGLSAFFISWLLRPNANSLHRLYRDRLSKAFLFNPDQKAPAERGRNTASREQGRDFKPEDTLKLSSLANQHVPYHLINAALNIQGSDYANRRGRNADFFLFSPLYVGSDATDYAKTTDMEPPVTSLDLATAMAISGAAFSSNMGANSVRPLTPTLALLNVRLGYWLANPRYAVPGATRPRTGQWNSAFFLLNEIRGHLFENSNDVYLTDGGHIENLGVYALLRRRCRVIIVVDAEADPAMRFSSLVTLQRYARIDLGIRIEMPWNQIRSSTLAWMGYGSRVQEGKPLPQKATGPHAAIGIIHYSRDEKGWLLYLKSSLTGDENDYVRDYARRFEQFPHETTSDQFFSEEQFEVYRALGFHMAKRLLAGEDGLHVPGEDEDQGAGKKPLFKFLDQHPSIDPLRTALL